MIQLFINGTELDLTDDINIPISYYQADAKNPESRKRSFSKDIVIPGTQRNNAFFMSAYNLNISDVYGDLIGFDFDPTLRYPAILKRNGRTIFSGSANLSKVITKGGLTNGRLNEFYVNIFAEVTDWFQQLGDIKISELDWSAYDFTLSVANITATWTAGVGSGVWYPYIQYGFSQDPLTIKTNQLFPFVYVKEIIEKCAEYAGYSILGSFFSASPFNRLTWGSGGGELITINPAEANTRLIDFTGVGSDSYEIAPSSIEMVSLTEFYAVFVGAKNYKFSDNASVTITQVQDDLGQMNETTGEVVIANTGSYQLNVLSNITIDYASANATALSKQFEISLKLNVFVNGAKITESVQTISATADGSLTFDLDLSQALTLSSGDVVAVNFYLSNAGSRFRLGGGGNMIIDTTFNSIAYSMSAEDAIVVDGDTVNISRFLPDMKAVDFMNDIITMFNMYISDPDDEGQVILLPEGDYFLDTDDTDNWSEKLDRSSDIEIKAATTIEGKTYKFKWAEDRDYYKQLYFDTYGNDYGDYNYNVPSTFKKGDKVYQLKSAQSCPVQIEATDIIIPHIFQLEESTGVVKPHKGKPRFLFNNGVAATATGWDLVNSDTLVASAQSTYPLAHHLDSISAPAFDLNFGVPTVVFYGATAYTNQNLFYNYHAQFIRQLIGRDSKIVNALFKLNENDFYTNFMRRLVNIDGVVFRKNSVKDWLANKPGVVKVELLKILEGNSRNMQGLDALPSPFEPNISSTGGGQVYKGDVTPRSNQSLYLFDTSSGNINVYLTARVVGTPFSGAPYGKVFTFKMVAGAGRVRIFPPQGGATIEGQSQYQITTINESASFVLLGESGDYVKV